MYFREVEWKCLAFYHNIMHFYFLFIRINKHMYTLGFIDYKFYSCQIFLVIIL